MGVCSQLVYMELVHEPKLDICHLRGLGAIYPKTCFVLMPICANDS